MAKTLTLILGGARSGKSHYAEKLAAESGSGVLYVATAQAWDEEMRQRIERHKEERPSSWQTLEAPLNTGQAIAELAGNSEVILLDCLTMLASNIIAPMPEPINAQLAEAQLQAEIDSLLTAYESSSAHWIIVTNEVGLGLVPPYPLGRVYRDALGRANQRLATVADSVLFMVAGLPMTVK